MKPPFKLPARICGVVLVAADAELITSVIDASEAERAYILWAVNNAHKMHKRLIKLELTLKESGFGDAESICGADLVDDMAKQYPKLVKLLGETKW